jgi:hypothetical protein
VTIYLDYAATTPVDPGVAEAMGAVLNAPTLQGNAASATHGAGHSASQFRSFGSATQEQFVALYDAIKPLGDLLKTSFFGSASPLNLKLPASAASDTD